MARVTILQISDLHRDPSNPIGNDALLTSLENDRHRYLTDDPGIPVPDIVVVSGDVIQGAAPGTHSFEDVLAAQHTEALTFLDALADRFLGGRRDRVVIVPGNHDVSACHAMASFKPIPLATDRKKELVAQLFNPDSPMRWSWNDFALFEIADQRRYGERMAPFGRFYEEFYQGSRHFDLDPEKQFDIFDFPEFDLTIVGFSSCHTNDILNRQGAIHPSCIGKVGTLLRGSAFAGRVRMAVWHHNTEGVPGQTDYMDPGLLQNLIDCGFSLGMHGHQHRPQSLDTRFRYGSDARITVISAGTLCGSSAPRFGRAYNIVELDTARRSGRLNVREMQNDNLRLPIWGRRALPPATATHLEFTFTPPPAPSVSAHEPTTLLIEAQALMDRGALEQAAILLRPVTDQDDLARRLLLDCLGRLHDANGILATFDPPKSELEAVYVMDALWEARRTDRLRALITDRLVSDATDSAVVEVRNKYAARLRT